jgi:hypothetical protein
MSLSPAVGIINVAYTACGGIQPPTTVTKARWQRHTSARHVGHWAEEYRKQILQKGIVSNVSTYHQWSNRIRVVLQGPRAHQQLAKFVILSIKCMGKANALYVPKRLINKIAEAGGAARVMHCIKGATWPRSATAPCFWPRQLSSGRRPGQVSRRLKMGQPPSKFKRKARDWQR